LYIRDEWEYALGLQRSLFVRPLYWTDAPFEPMPSELRELHFSRLDLRSRAQIEQTSSISEERHALVLRAQNAWNHAAWAQAIESWEALRSLNPPEPHADEYLDAIARNQREDFRYKMAQRLAHSGAINAARQELEILYSSAPYYGDPQDLSCQTGVPVPQS